MPPLPAAVWHRAPGGDDGLLDAAAAYYGTPHLAPIGGTPAATQLLPTLLPRAMVALLGASGEAHAEAWTQAGHRLRRLPEAPLQRALAAVTPYVLVENPHPQSAKMHSRDDLLAVAAQLRQRGGWLIVDESAIDATPEASLTPLAGSEAAPNVVTLRSLDPFFGLAGTGVAFIAAAPALLEKLGPALAHWPIPGPSRAAARLALTDQAWQSATRDTLRGAAERLAALLAPLGETRSTPLFSVLTTTHAEALAAHLATHGIAVGIFGERLRFGLPADAAAWMQLSAALGCWSPQ